MERVVDLEIDEAHALSPPTDLKFQSIDPSAQI